MQRLTPGRMVSHALQKYAVGGAPGLELLLMWAEIAAGRQFADCSRCESPDGFALQTVTCCVCTLCSSAEPAVSWELHKLLKPEGAPASSSRGLRCPERPRLCCFSLFTSPPP